jgi:hypothetical protein
MMAAFAEVQGLSARLYSMLTQVRAVQVDLQGLVCVEVERQPAIWEEKVQAACAAVRGCLNTSNMALLVMVAAEYSRKHACRSSRERRSEAHRS